MRIERNLLTSLADGEARERVRAHLTAAHYRQTSDGAEMAFQRGSIVGSVLSFSSKGSFVQVYVRPRPSGLEINLEILFLVSTAGRIVTKGERGYWESEADKLEATLKPSASASEQSIEYSTPAEYSVPAETLPASQSLSPAAQPYIALIFATQIFLFCLAVGWVATHSMPGVLIGLIIGAGAAFVLMGVLTGVKEKDETVGDEDTELEQTGLEKPEGTEP